MICKNCGAQTEGNFCNNCGAPLPKEVAGNNESMDAEYKVYNEEDIKVEIIDCLKFVFSKRWA